MFVILANADWWIFDHKSFLLGKTTARHKYSLAKDKKWIFKYMSYPHNTLINPRDYVLENT
jgi:hypothetical protein